MEDLLVSIPLLTYHYEPRHAPTKILHRDLGHIKPDQAAAASRRLGTPGRGERSAEHAAGATKLVERYFA